jgi:Spy/CpxP family protein refolding chaperone
MSKTTLFAIATTVTLATGLVAAQTAPPPQQGAAARPAVQGVPPQGQPPQGQPQQGQPTAAGPGVRAGQPGQAAGMMPMGRGPATPGPQGPAPQMRPQGDMAPWAGLGLNDEQREKVRDVQRATRDQAAPIEDELLFTRRSLHRELYADKRDNAKVTALAAKIAGLEKQLSDIHIKQAMAVADLLTPRQRETMRIGAGPNGPAPVRR